jgi:hypothetical protein
MFYTPHNLKLLSAQLWETLIFFRVVDSGSVFFLILCGGDFSRLMYLVGYTGLTSQKY